MSEAQGFRLPLSKSPIAECSPFFIVQTSGRFRDDFNLRRLNCQKVSHYHKRRLLGQIKRKLYVTQHCSSLHAVLCYSEPSTCSRAQIHFNFKIKKNYIFHALDLCNISRYLSSGTLTSNKHFTHIHICGPR